jgi:uncharacterized YigZ family protein
MLFTVVIIPQEINIFYYFIWAYAIIEAVIYVNSIKAIAIVDDEIKKSRFISILYPVDSEEAVLNALSETKAKYPNATHYCYAYILGHHAEIQKSSDDGEPQKTAGFPMLEILKKNDLTQILAVVVRYFGGVKLGSGGLIRAYAQSVRLALKRSFITKSVEYLNCEITVDYGAAGGLEYYLHSLTGEVEKKYGGDQMIFTFTIESRLFEKTNEMVKKLTNFRSEIQNKISVIRYI